MLSGITRVRGNNMSAHTLGDFNKNRANSGEVKAQHQNNTMLFNSVSGGAFAANQSSCLEDDIQPKPVSFNTGVKINNNLTTMPNTQNQFYSHQFDPFITGTNFSTLMVPQGHSHSKHFIHSPQQHSAQCNECQFEREKRMVTQKAFERAMQISMYLMQEIEKLSLSSHQEQPLAINRDDIVNLINGSDPLRRSQIIARSKSQNVMLEQSRSFN